MRRVTLKRPFTGGMITDVPAHDLGPTYSPFIQDGFVPNGVLRQRAGWAYDGTTADVADNLVSVRRNSFVLADVTRTMTCDDDGDIYIHNNASSGTLLLSGDVEYLPRCVYNDQLIWCAQDGLTPLRLHSGAIISGTMDDNVGSGVANYGSDEATIVDTAFSSAPGVGAYLVGRIITAAEDVPLWIRAVESSTTSHLLEGVRANGDTFFSCTAEAFGYTFPCVAIYNAGTATTNGSGSITGYGTKWQSGQVALRSTVSAGPDGLVIVPPARDSEFFSLEGVTSDTATGGGGGSGVAITDKSNYTLVRRCNWTDAAAHKGSLWGSGNAFYPNRVYVSPPGWLPAFPPGASIPFTPDAAASWSSSNANDYLLDFIDIPSVYDGDNVIAILPSASPLLVLKRKAVYGVFGSFPNFSVDMVADGIGCIDIRSAWSYDEGQFWAGETGIFWYRNGQITDLTAGRINREWRELARDFDYGTSDYCTLGLSQGYLIVHITTGGGTTQRTYQCNLADGAWSRISNFTPRFMFTSRIPGEQEKLLAVSNARQGRVIDFAPALNGEGTAKDDAGSGPRLQAYTPEGMDGSSIDDDTRLIDLAVHANVYDSGASGSTSMAVSVVTQDALTSSGTTTTTLADIDSDTTDRLDRHYYRSVNKRGRRHQVRFDVDTTGTDAASTKVEIHQIDATFRETRGRT